MIVVYARQPFPTAYSKSMFLVGPTPRQEEGKPTAASWRVPEALNLLRKLEYDGVVFVPEDEDGEWRNDYVGQVEWEEEGLNHADCIVCWFDRELKLMPAFTSNDEWGFWKDSGKVVFGAPPGAPKVSYQKYYAQKYGVPIADTLEETLRNAIAMIGEGAYREGSECHVPLYIWRTESFQQWYRALKASGNRLDGARVKWTWRVGPNRSIVFFWTLHVNVFIDKEGRQKTNEVVIGRPDVSTVLMHRRGATFYDTEIVLVREFRSPVANPTGYVWELPSGSSWELGRDFQLVASDECHEETGLSIFPNRFFELETRQVAATMPAHRAHLYSVELNEGEMEFLRAQSGVPHGVEADTERTYVEVVKLGEILRDGRVDWATLGMILSALKD